MSRPSLQNFSESRGSLSQSALVRPAAVASDARNSLPSNLALARFFDGLLAKNFSATGGPVQTALSTGVALNLRDAVQRFPVLQRQLVDLLGEENLEGLYRCAQLRSPDLFYGALFRMARRAVSHDKEDLAVSLCRFLIASQSKQAPQAERLLQVLTGGGAWVDRIEVQAPRFMLELRNPATLLGMATGLTVSSRVQGVVLPQLWRRGFQGFAARSLSALSAFVPEVGAVWSSSKILSEHLSGNSVSWEAQNNFYELRSLALSLAGLKLMGFAAGQAHSTASYRVAQGRAGAIARWVNRSGPRLWHQMGLGAGILLGHQAEVALGWRPENSKSLLFDAALQWLNFNLAGSLSQSLFPGVYHRHQIDQARLRQEEFVQRQRIENKLSLDFLFSQVKSAEALSFAGGGASWVASTTDPRLTRLEMSGLGDFPPGSGGPSLADIPVRRPHRPTSGSERQALPDRTGGRIDPFEQVFTEGNFSSLMLSQISSQAQALIHGPSGRSSAVLSSQDFGRFLGEGILRGIQEYFPQGIKTIPHEMHGQGTTPTEGMRALDEVVGVVEYAYRTGQREVTRSFETALSVEPEMGLLGYDALKTGLRHLLDVPIKNADGSYNVLSGNEAMVSVGNGDMLSLLSLMRHRIRPGDLSWRYRLFAVARSPEAAREINEQGTYEKKLGKDRRINFLHDPAIVAIGPQGHENLQQVDVLRSIQYQILNVNSANLHEVLARPGYLENLPAGAHLLHVIKGWIGADRGIYSPKSGEQPTLLPYELVQLALSRAGRADVSITSGGGFIPGKHLWWGKPVEMAFASREDSPGSRISSAARDWAWQFTGHENFSTPYLTASHHHHQHSTDLGGAMKNVVSTWAGLMATQWAFENYQRRHEVNDHEMTGVLRGHIIPELEARMVDMLRRDNVVRPGKPLRFHAQVRDDFEKCCSVQMRALLDLATMALRPEVPIYDQGMLENWVLQNVVQRRAQFADTRNPIMGVVTALVEKWNSAPLFANIEPLAFLTAVAKKGGLTTEGLDSLAPLLKRNQYAAHPIEYRDIDPLFLGYHNMFYPSSRAHPGLTLPNSVHRALGGSSELYSGVEVSALRHALQAAWERQSQASVDVLGQELARLAEIQSQHDSDPQYRFKLHNQKTMLRHLMAAMAEGEVFPVKVFSEQDPLFNSFAIPVGRIGAREPNHFRVFLRIDGAEMLRLLGELPEILQKLDFSKDDMGRISEKEIVLHVETAHLPVEREALAKAWQQQELRLPTALAEPHRQVLQGHDISTTHELTFRQLPDEVQVALNEVRSLHLASRQDISEGLQSIFWGSPGAWGEGQLRVILNGSPLAPISPM